MPGWITSRVLMSLDEDIFLPRALESSSRSRGYAPASLPAWTLTTHTETRTVSLIESLRTVCNIILILKGRRIVLALLAIRLVLSGTDLAS